MHIIYCKYTEYYQGELLGTTKILLLPIFDSILALFLMFFELIVCLTK